MWNDSLTAKEQSARSVFICLIEAFCEAASWALVMCRGRSMTTEMATMTINANAARTHGRRYQTALVMPNDDVGIDAGSNGTCSKPERSSVIGKDYRRSRRWPVRRCVGSNDSVST